MSFDQGNRTYSSSFDLIQDDDDDDINSKARKAVMILEFVSKMYEAHIDWYSFGSFFPSLI
jgi:hypothetical protein